jgi:hypothetical protein
LRQRQFTHETCTQGQVRNAFGGGKGARAGCGSSFSGSSVQRRAWGLKGYFVSSNPGYPSIARRCRNGAQRAAIAGGGLVGAGPLFRAAPGGELLFEHQQFTVQAAIDGMGSARGHCWSGGT